MGPGAIILMSAALWTQDQAPFSCAAVAASAPSREALRELSDQNDQRLQQMIDRLRQIASRSGAGEADVRAEVERVQPETDAFASAFEAGMCAHYLPEVTPAAEAMVRRLGDNIRGAPVRMRDATLSGTPLGQQVSVDHPTP